MTKPIAVEEKEARAAYVAFVGFMGGHPRWEDLAEQERGAWYAAAAAAKCPPPGSHPRDATPREIDAPAPTGGHATRFDEGDEE